MKFRVKHIKGIGFFAQVKTWGSWDTIHVNQSGFKLVSPKTVHHPISQRQAEVRCHEYEDWIYRTTEGVTYTKVKVSR